MINDILLIGGVILTGYSVGGIYQDLKERYKRFMIERNKNKVKLSDTQLLIGYDTETFKPIIVDMEITPHLLVCGLSRCGKSRMIEFAMKDKNVILLNVFKNDFKTLKGVRRTNDYIKIKECLKSLNTEPYYRKEPLYIVIDEMLVLCNDKDIVKAISELLAVARHYNIYIIGISQIGDRETVKFKNLFNVRICFRAVEESTYRTVLGYSPEITDLLPRQFHLYSDKLAFGATYDIRPDD